VKGVFEHAVIGATFGLFIPCSWFKVFLGVNTMFSICRGFFHLVKGKLFCFPQALTLWFDEAKSGDCLLC